MKWAVVAVVVTLVAIAAVNVALLTYSGDRHDPVGQLSPVASIQHQPQLLVYACAGRARRRLTLTESDSSPT